MFRRVLMALALLVVVGVGSVSAQQTLQGDQCAVEADQAIRGNLFVLCRVLTIEGRVTGNVLGAAASAIINGEVDGSLYLVAGQLDVYGTLGGDIHFAGPVLIVHNDAQMTDTRGDVLSASLSTSFARGADVPGSIIAVGYQLLVDGAVGDGVTFWGGALQVQGAVRGGIDAQVGDPQADVTQLQTLLTPFRPDINLVNPGVRVLRGGTIDGDLRYSSPDEGQIDGEVTGEIVFTPVITQPDFTQITTLGEETETRGLGLYLSQVVREFTTLALVGILALLVAPRAMQAPQRHLQTRPLVSMGVGLLVFVVSFPVFVIVFFLSLLVVLILSALQLGGLTVAVGFILGILDIGSASAFYFTAIFVARVVVCLMIGQFITRAVFPTNTNPRMVFASMLIGVALLAVLDSLPAVGLVINAVTAFLGFGAILLITQIRVEELRENATAPRYVTLPQALAHTAEVARLMPPPPPPIIEDTPRPVGMDNLPEGFKMWDE